MRSAGVMLGRAVLKSVVMGLLLWAGPAVAAEYAFEVTIDPAVRTEPFTGRVYLFFAKGDREPRFGPNWFNPGPMLAVDVRSLKPGDPLRINTTDTSGQIVFPQPLRDLDLAGYNVQAVARFNPLVREVGAGAGNGYSSVRKIEGSQEQPAAAKLSINTLVEERQFPENDWCKLLELRSERLSKFHGREVRQRASVVLPASYQKEPERRYPVIFIVQGFGGNHFAGLRKEPVAEENPGGVEFLRVYLDAETGLGHHVFADSANNGPVGTALVEELIPALDAQYRTIAQPTARFLTGHSSGGWSTLWLQVAYPDTFGGCWSTAPDPVDFRDFQRINLYRAGENMYRDPQGERRPLARVNGQVMLWYDDFDRMEELVGPGGQLHSFEAVFSPRGADGRPVRVWNRRTGEVDTLAAEAWKKYDIRLILETQWATLGPKLAGKLHVIMGDADTFYLEGATRLLQESQQQLQSDAVVELVPGKDHGNLLTRELTTRIRTEMAESFLKHHPAPQLPAK